MIRGAGNGLKKNAAGTSSASGTEVTRRRRRRTCRRRHRAKIARSLTASVVVWITMVRRVPPQARNALQAVHIGVSAVLAEACVLSLQFGCRLAQSFSHAHWLARDGCVASDTPVFTERVRSRS